MKIQDRIISVLSPVKGGMEFDFADAIEVLIHDAPDKDIILDLTRTPFINSAALSILLNCHRELKKKNAQLRLRIKKKSDIAHLVEITKLEAIFEIEWTET
jgi:anti-anti-sigma factor